MGLYQTLMFHIGFEVGLPLGLFLGFIIFIFFEPRDVKDQIIRPVQALKSDDLVDLLPELPPWVMNPDYERVDWFNNVVLDMWPYLDKAICELIRSTTKPIFEECIGSYLIKSINFEQLTLGTIPATIHGLKVVDTNENELVFDLTVRWAGNPNIVLVLKLLRIEITVQLVDLQITATTRITLSKCVPTFPCFSSILVSLMEKPEVDFGLKIMGGDVMAIPGVYGFVQESISKQVARLYLWPQAFEVPILDSAGSAMKPVGILHVKVVKAQNLLNKDLLGKSDPYVKLRLSGERLLKRSRKTSVIKNNLNPEWNEDFKMTVKDPDSQTLQIDVRDWDKAKLHDKLGMQEIALNMLKPYQKETFELDLVYRPKHKDTCHNENRGQIILELTFVPFIEDSFKFKEFFESLPSFPKDNFLQGAGLLLVTIIGAKEVEGKHHKNPYVQILFRGEQRNTKLIKKTRNPMWIEEFQYVLEEAPLKEEIHIEVMSKIRGMGIFTKESLGYVDIKLSDVVYNGHINEKYHLINSSRGVIHIDIQWKAI